MSKTLGLFTTGQNVSYQGKGATVVSNNYASNTITISQNGEVKIVDKNDLFGMNKTGSSVMNFYRNSIKSYNERIEKYEENVAIAKQTGAMAKNKLKIIQKKMRQLFSKNNAKEAKDLRSGSAKLDYQKLMAQQTDANSSIRMADWDESSNLMACFNEILSRGKVMNQQIVAESYLSQFGLA